MAWALADKIQLLDYHREDPKVESAPAKAVQGFAVVANGNRPIRIIAVTYPMAHALDRQGDGNWGEPTELNLSECTTPGSVSPGAQYVSATWRAKACFSPAMKDATEFSLREETDDATHDVIWSAAGHAFAEILLSRDIIVGRSDRFETQSGSHIKGANLGEGDGDWSPLISMSEAGTRVALIDREDAVRIYSLADHKPLLSRFDEGPVAVAPDGSWIAVARRPVSDEQTWAVDVIPIDLAFNSDFPSRTRIPMEEPSTQITEIYAAQSSVVAVLQAERATTTVVFDSTTGKRRFDPFEGQVEELGTARELLLIRETKPPWGRVLTRDGSPLAPWGELSAADGPPVFLVSPGKEALAVLRGQAGNAKEANAIVYSVRGDGLVIAGQVVGLPAELLSDPDRLQLADDARSITETRWEDNVPEKFVWPVTSGREAASARLAPAVETPVVSASPSGRFEMREESEADTDVRTFTVVRRAFGNVEEHPLKSFRDATYRFGHRFSNDDRWLATWNEKGIQILDLGRGDNAWDLDPGGVKNVDFEAGNAILNVQLSGDATTLIPLDGALMERFAKWLVPGALTPEERCQYGLESEEKCR